MESEVSLTMQNPAVGLSVVMDPASVRLWRNLPSGRVVLLSWDGGEKLLLDGRKTLVLTLTRNTTSLTGDKTDDVAMAVSGLAGSRPSHPSLSDVLYDNHSINGG